MLRICDIQSSAFILQATYSFTYPVPNLYPFLRSIKLWAFEADLLPTRCNSMICKILRTVNLSHDPYTTFYFHLRSIIYVPLRSTFILEALFCTHPCLRLRAFGADLLLSRCNSMVCKILHSEFESRSLKNLLLFILEEVL